jgi:hypothetical protein
MLFAPSLIKVNRRLPISAVGYCVNDLATLSNASSRLPKRLTIGFAMCCDHYGKGIIASFHPDRNLTAQPFDMFWRSLFRTC